MISPKTYYELSFFKDSPVSLDGKLTDRILCLEESKFVKRGRAELIEVGDGDFYSSTREWSITPLGEDVLQEYEQSLEDEVKRESNQRKERISQKRFDFLLAVIGAIAGIVFDRLMIWMSP